MRVIIRGVLMTGGINEGHNDVLRVIMTTLLLMNPISTHTSASVHYKICKFSRRTVYRIQNLIILAFLSVGSRQRKRCAAEAL